MRERDHSMVQAAGRRSRGCDRVKPRGRVHAALRGPIATCIRDASSRGPPFQGHGRRGEGAAETSCDEGVAATGAEPLFNPEGIASSSPGLRGTSCPGDSEQNGHQPQRGCGPGCENGPQPPSGLRSYSPRFPRVARSSQPWALGRNPFGIRSWWPRKMCVMRGGATVTEFSFHPPASAGAGRHSFRDACGLNHRAQNGWRR